MIGHTTRLVGNYADKENEKNYQRKDMSSESQLSSKFTFLKTAKKTESTRILSFLIYDLYQL